MFVGNSAFDILSTRNAGSRDVFFRWEKNVSRVNSTPESCFSATCRGHALLLRIQDLNVRKDSFLGRTEAVRLKPLRSSIRAEYKAEAGAKSAHFSIPHTSFFKKKAASPKGNGPFNTIRIFLTLRNAFRGSTRPPYREHHFDVWRWR